MISIPLTDEKNCFQAILAPVDSLMALAKVAVDFIHPVIRAQHGHMYLYLGDTANIKAIYSNFSTKPQSMPAPQKNALIIENQQALIPIYYNDKLLGAMIFEGVEEESVRQGLHFIKDALPFLSLKLSGLIDKTCLEQKIRVINEHQLCYELGIDGRISDISYALAQELGYEKAELIGKQPNFLTPDSSSTTNEFKLIKRDGSELWVKSQVTATRDYWGNDAGGKLYFQQNISREKMIEEMAIRDDLTGLYNRRYFNQMFGTQIDLAKRTKSCLAFMIIDIDNFKKYNDTYGHQEGDRVLKQVAQTLDACYKRKGDFVFRLGGEEFGIICNVTLPEDAEILANYARKAVTELAIPHTGNPVFKIATISTGLVTITVDNILGDDDIYKTADIALYEAKESGRNQVKVAGQSDDIELF